MRSQDGRWTSWGAMAGVSRRARGPRRRQGALAALLLFGAVSLIPLAACGDGAGGYSDAGLADGAWPDGQVDAAWPPPREELAPPESYDCNAVGSPPERVSTLALGCFGDLGCEGLVVVAHRGLGYLAPQNTLSAMRAAVVMGVDMMELDVRLSSDGVPVVIHNAEVDATTDGTGEVVSKTLAELQALHVTYHEELVGDFSCERIPTFREALQLARGRIDLMVDLKQGAAEAALVIEEEGMVAQAVMLGSLSELEEARAAVADLRIMIRPGEQAEIQPLWDAFVPAPDVVHIDPGFDDPPTIELIHGLGAKVLMDLWTADANALILGDISQYSDAYEAGIDIGQCELAFLALWSVGRGAPP